MAAARANLALNPYTPATAGFRVRTHVRARVWLGAVTCVCAIAALWWSIDTLAATRCGSFSVNGRYGGGRPSGERCVCLLRPN